MAQHTSMRLSQACQTHRINDTESLTKQAGFTPEASQKHSTDNTESLAQACERKPDATYQLCWLKSTSVCIKQPKASDMPDADRDVVASRLQEAIDLPEFYQLCPAESSEVSNSLRAY